MTRGEINTLILGWLDDPNAGYFTSALTNTWINNAQKEVQKQLIQAGEMYYQKSAQTLTIPDQRDYVMPTDFLKIDRIELVISGTGVDENKVFLNGITLNQQGLVDQGSGVPQCYDLKKDRFSLYPTPTKQYVLRMFYEYRVANMVSDSDIPDVPEEFHEYIAIIAAFNGYIKDDRVPNNLTQKYSEYKELLEQMAQERDESAPRMVVATENDGSGIIF